jgi:hypothetical protein
MRMKSDSTKQKKGSTGNQSVTGQTTNPPLMGEKMKEISKAVDWIFCLKEATTHHHLSCDQLRFLSFVVQ